MEINIYFEILNNTLSLVDRNELDNMIYAIYKAYVDGTTIFIIGNGGSAANASHFAQDLSKGVILDQNVRKRIKALSLTDNVPYITALGNDNGYDSVFVSQLRTFSCEGDLLIAISGSGKSKNILAAVEYARNNGMKVIGVTGYDGGELKSLSDTSVHVPLNEMCMAESIHSILFHYIISFLRMKITGEKFDENSFR
jgi:D-sedoheptulose 7-phosphate isomerase